MRRYRFSITFRRFRKQGLKSERTFRSACIKGSGNKALRPGKAFCSAHFVLVNWLDNLPFLLPIMKELFPDKPFSLDQYKAYIQVLPSTKKTLNHRAGLSNN